MLEAARKLMREGRVPSVADAAEAAEVSRATAYRYFPSQAALFQAAIDELIGPQEFDEAEPVERVRAVAHRVVGLTAREEPLLRGSLRLALEQWARRQAGQDLDEDPVRRGGRRAAIAAALEPVAAQLEPAARARLEAALALLVGIEARIVLTDICGLEDAEVEAVVDWAATTLARDAFGG